MSIKGKGVLFAVSALGLILAGTGQALAQGHSGGGGGGGHGSSGGHAGGGGHGAVGHAGGAHFAGSGRVGGGGAHFATGFHGGGFAGRGGGFAGRGGFGSPGRFTGHGFSTGLGWRGGFWRGGFWPRSFFGAGFAWFLPILPLAYATYWYDGIPYYYANDVYYTWNPSYDGYVATDPPPVADSSGSGSYDSSGSGPAPTGDSGAQQGPGPGGPSGQIFMYPKNGQSTEQQASDKAECQKWASDQAGQVAQNGSDYSRAMAACVEGRGYSAR
jgi:hypothetical protein